MNAELRFISCLLYAQQDEKREFWTKQLPVSIFEIHQKEASWLYRYRETYGQFPTVKAFLAKFDDLEEEFKPVMEPLFSTLEPVLTQHAYRQIKNVVEKTREQFDSKSDPEEIISQFRAGAETIRSFSVTTVNEDLRDPDTAYRRYVQSKKEASRKGKGFVDTPWPTLNRLLTYLRPGDVVAISARTSIGKTWMAMTWANYLGRKGIETLVVSKEMPTPAISDRMTALRYGLDWEQFRSMSLDVETQLQWKAQALVEKRKKLFYTVDVSGEETMEGIGIEQVYALAMQYKPRVLIIDGAYLLSTKQVGKNANDAERYAAISRAVKRMAKVMKCVVIPILQMNRKAEKDGGVAKGNIATVFGSDAWAQDADVLIELCGERGSPERIVSVLKSRESNIGDFYINFKLSPRPVFTEKNSLSHANNSSVSKLPFRVIK